MCLYLRCIFDVLCLYLVCIVCISQNVSESMRLATFRAKNTSKYIQYRHIHTNTNMTYIQKYIHYTYKINQLLCVCMRMYVRVCACIFLYFVCMYVLLHYFGCKHVSECMCMYLYVSIHCHCSPVFIRERLGYIEYLKLQSTLEKAFLFEILFYFSKGHSRVVRGPHHGPRVDVVQAAA